MDGRRTFWNQIHFATQVIALGCSLMLLPACQSPCHADRGALIGGLTGAGVGAAIGDANGNRVAGTAIGTAVGALAGAAAGNELDQAQAHQEAMLVQHVSNQKAAHAASMHDAISMTQAGLGDSVIIEHFRANGVTRPPSADELISLKQQGVSDEVIHSWLMISGGLQIDDRDSYYRYTSPAVRM